MSIMQKVALTQLNWCNWKDDIISVFSIIIFYVHKMSQFLKTSGMCIRQVNFVKFSFKRNG